MSIQDGKVYVKVQEQNRCEVAKDILISEIKMLDFYIKKCIEYYQDLPCHEDFLKEIEMYCEQKRAHQRVLQWFEEKDQRARP